MFDAVGKSSFEACRRLLVPGGVYVSTELGTTGQNPLLALAGPLGRLVGARRVLFPIPTSTRDDIEFLGQRLADGNFAPVIDRTYSLDQIVEAFEYVGTGQKLGNVVIQIARSRELTTTATNQGRKRRRERHRCNAAPEGRTGCLLILC